MADWFTSRNLSLVNLYDGGCYGSIRRDINTVLTAIERWSFVHSRQITSKGRIFAIVIMSACLSVTKLSCGQRLDIAL